MKHLYWIIPVLLLFWTIFYGGDTDPDWYDEV